MENGTFSYSYSSKRNREVERIRRKYLPSEENKIEQLRRLDRKADGAGVAEGLAVGIIGALIMGIGICFFLGVFGFGQLLSIFLLPLGLSVMVFAYPTYRKTSHNRRAELAPEIMRLSEEILRSEKISINKT